MKILIVGDVYSIHTRRWVEHFTEKHEVYLAYLPRTSLSDVKLLFFSNHSARLTLLPLGSPNMLKILRIPRYALLKLSGNRYYFSFGSRSMKKAIKKVKPDIVHAHFLFLPDHGWLTSKEEFHPLVLSVWGSDMALVKEGSNEQRKLTQVFRKGDLVTVGDGASKKRLIEFGCDPNKIFIQAWGIDVERFSPLARKEELRSKILGKKEGLIVTFVCALKKIWDVPTLIKAVPNVISKGKNVKFLIIGEGSEKKNLQKLIESLGVGDHVTLTGRLSSEKINIYLASSDIYI
ncbi:MAG: glycosyltransferase, partial [Thermoplasmata archaeon]|nr:glycosyltransferase [Thermoplasmata archaeon]